MEQNRKTNGIVIFGILTIKMRNLTWITHLFIDKYGGRQYLSHPENGSMIYYIWMT